MVGLTHLAISCHPLRVEVACSRLLNLSYVVLLPLYELPVPLYYGLGVLALVRIGQRSEAVALLLEDLFPQLVLLTLLVSALSVQLLNMSLTHL